MNDGKSRAEALETTRTLITKLQTASKLLCDEKPSIIDFIVGLEVDAVAIANALADMADSPKPVDIAPVSAPEIEVERESKGVEGKRARKGEYVFSPRKFRRFAYETAETLSDFSVRIGKCNAQVSEWATGKTRPKKKTLYDMADSLGMDRKEFVSRVCEEML